MNDLEAALREAIAGGEWARAGALWAKYSAELEDAVRNGREASARLAAARDLLEWARPMALAFRARALQDLSVLRIRREYAAGPHAPAGGGVRLSG